AMGERQVSIGNITYKLPKLFLVMATQNPIEQEGTFSLPEAQLDRFMMHVKIGYPERAVEKQILLLNRKEQKQLNSDSEKRIFLTQEEIFSIREEVVSVHMDESIEDYI